MSTEGRAMCLLCLLRACSFRDARSLVSFPRVPLPNEFADGVRSSPIKKYEAGAGVEGFRKFLGQILQQRLTIIVCKIEEISADEIPKATCVIGRAVTYTFRNASTKPQLGLRVNEGPMLFESLCRTAP